MPNKIIDVRLSTDSIERAIREIEQYRQEQNTRCEILAERVAELIRKQAQAGFAHAVADDLTQISGGPIQANVKVSVTKEGNVAVVIASGHDAVWVEFGAGVHHNGSVGSRPNPLGDKLGFAIGTYGRGFGSKDKWPFPVGDGTSKWSYGTPAAKPMFKAVMAVKGQIVQIGREVFGL